MHTITNSLKLPTSSLGITKEFIFMLKWIHNSLGKHWKCTSN